jgi:hypothetical protein
MIYWTRNMKKTHSPVRAARRRSAAPVLENLDQRCLLDAGIGMGHAHHRNVMDVQPLPPTLVPLQTISSFNGVVVKNPHFYEKYIGPKLTQLNAVAAAGFRSSNGNFEFIGVNQGAIDPKVQATYVFGIDRSGKLPTGPFPNRPNIRFDAVVVVKVVPGNAPTATVTDLAANKSTALSASAFRISGHSIAAKVSASLLPSTGLDSRHFKFAYWPEDGQPGAQHIASFAPEFSDTRIGEIGTEL